MPPAGITEITVKEDGTETHESWLLIRANRYSSTGTRLFDSELNHQHFIGVTITRCERKRNLKHDWLHSTKTLLDMYMSEAQWGAFVSSFGDGSGVPATLYYFNGGLVPNAPAESRLDESHREVREAADEALADIQQSFADLETAFEEGVGKKALREKIRDLHSKIGNAPSGMEFAAKSLTEHAENVTTKARADIEAMVATAQANGIAISPQRDVLELTERS